MTKTTLLVLPWVLSLLAGGVAGGAAGATVPADLAARVKAYDIAQVKSDRVQASRDPA